MSRKNYEIGFLGDPFFDDFDDFFTVPKAYHRFENNVMKTDIQEIDNNYVLKVDIPGAKKEDISLKLNDGYLEIGYVVKNENEEKKDTMVQCLDHFMLEMLISKKILMQHIAMEFLQSLFQ